MRGSIGGQSGSEDILRCMIDTEDELPQGEYNHIELSGIQDDIDDHTLVVVKGVPFARDYRFFITKAVERSVLEDYTGEGTSIEEVDQGFYVRGDFMEWSVKSIVPDIVDRYILLQTTSLDRFREAERLLRDR